MSALDGNMPEVCPTLESLPDSAVRLGGGGDACCAPVCRTLTAGAPHAAAHPALDPDCLMNQSTGTTCAPGR